MGALAWESWRERSSMSCFLFSFLFLFFFFLLRFCCSYFVFVFVLNNNNRFTLVHETKKGGYVWLDSKNNQPVKMTSQYVCVDTGIPATPVLFLFLFVFHIVCSTFF